MLYKVTNLRDEDVTFAFSMSPEWNFWVEKDGENIWTAVEAWWMFGTGFTLASGEYKEFPDYDPPGIWDMSDRDGNLVSPGQYTVIGGLHAGSGQYENTKVSVTIEIMARQPKLYYVDAADGNDNNDGLSPETAFAAIQTAIDATFDGDTVIVADGAYTSEPDRGIDFRGKAIIVKSQNGPESCVIDCQNLSRGFYFHNGEDANSVLDGFTITAGYHMSAGGILCSESSPTIKNCTISNNTASSAGGILCLDSSPVITDCIITGNHADAISGSGGGIECLGGDPLITNCVISGNSANWVGGAIICRYSSPTITNCTITGNSATTGGGIHCYESNAAMTNCILWDNRAETGSQIGLTSTHSHNPCTLTLSYTDLQGGQDNVFVGSWSTLNRGPGNIDADPCFVTCGYWDHNGTPNYIWDDSWVDGDYHLLETSPCVDAGDPNYSPGPNKTDLDGNPRVTGYAVDMGAYEYPLPLVAQINIRPRTINLRSQGKWLTCHISLPDGYNAADIDPDTILLEDEIKTASFRIHSGAPGAVAFFSRRNLQDILGSGRVELTITGRLTDGTEFMGIDTIKVIDNPPPKPARPRKPRVNLRPLRRTKIAIG